MKTASILFCAAFILASVSCDSHSFEETKVLHEGMHKHDGHGHGHDAHAEKKEGGHDAHDEAKKDAAHH